ncbi:hypothetical protein AEAC466_01320 [Asticcacaulis sp. AC466]|nr:hypothetical protein AEAC466_01320 [Asticcacaulis sp. AC466]
MKPPIAHSGKARVVAYPQVGVFDHAAFTFQNLDETRFVENQKAGDTVAIVVRF